MLRLATVEQVRTEAPARCRVRTGDLLTDWLPWLTLRAGGATGATWWAPVQGEQCLLLAPGGDLLQAVVLPGIYSDAMDAPSDNADVMMMQWSPDDHLTYMDGGLTIQCVDQIVLKVGEASVEITESAIRLSAGGATLELSGGVVTAASDVIAGGVSLISHIHTGVITGPMLSGPPVG